MRTDGIEREVYFENIYGHITQLLWKATYSVKICVAWISADRFRNIFSHLRNKGVSIEIIYDQNRSNDPIQQFNGQIANIYPIRNWQGGFMHNKFCIIDDKILINGSFNWTYNADVSLENALMIAGDYRLIKAYLHEFEDLKGYSHFCSEQRPIYPFHEDQSPCRSLSYNVGVFGYADGISKSQKVSIWTVCKAHQRARMRKIFEVPSSFDDENDLYDLSEDDWYESREKMLNQFKLERKIIEAPRLFFIREMGLEIHAYGFVELINDLSQNTQSSDPKYFLQLDWRHMYWRKIIPSKLFHYNGDIKNIIQMHRPRSICRN